MIMAHGYYPSIRSFNMFMTGGVAAGPQKTTTSTSKQVGANPNPETQKIANLSQGKGSMVMFNGEAMIDERVLGEGMSTVPTFVWQRP